MSAGVLCTIYRSSRERETFLYVAQAEGLERVPPELLARLGSTSEVMTIELTPERKLARARSPQVLAAIAEMGYFLQLPPELQVAQFTMGE